ncbi:MAG: hypothetical protein K0U84_08675 [Actinomycetia bacterium]|nr:hypothetical protein [Actinomycetes bacterium]
MPSSQGGGGRTLEVSQPGLATVAATMSSASTSLAALSAAPPVHAPLATDEVSTSAAARLSEHGAVLSSRASDGAAVLEAAARAVLAISAHMAQIDTANAAALALGPQTSAPSGGLGTSAAAKINAVAAPTPITPMAPRLGEVTAALIEAGSSSTGATFQNSCRAYGSAFEAGAVAARSAQGALADAITGRTGPRLSTALAKFATWADQMASHAETVAQHAQDHGGRLERTQHETPKTQQFADTRQSLNRAQELNMRTGGMASGLVVQYANRLQQLDSTATAAGVSYHLTELPQAPPPPPPVTDIVDGDSAAPSSEDSAQPAEGEPGQTDNPADGATDGAQQPGETPDPDAEPSVLGSHAEPLTDPLATEAAGASPAGDPMQQMAPMAAMLPSALAGALGGAMGAATSVPQQVMGAAQQVMQGAAAAMEDPDLGLDIDPLSSGLSDFGGGGLGNGGGGGGAAVEPAGVDTSLPPGGGALAAASAPPAGPPVPTSSAAVSGPKAAPTGAGMGGMPMMMPPMMGGMGAGAGANASRPTQPPDKTVVVPSIPNEEPVKGEVERRQVASVDEPTPAKPEAGEPASGRPRRRVVVAPPPDPGEAK